MTLRMIDNFVHPIHPRNFVWKVENFYSGLTSRLPMSAFGFFNTNDSHCSKMDNFHCHQSILFRVNNTVMKTPFEHMKWSPSLIHPLALGMTHVESLKFIRSMATPNAAGWELRPNSEHPFNLKEGRNALCCTGEEVHKCSRLEHHDQSTTSTIATYRNCEWGRTCFQSAIWPHGHWRASYLGQFTKSGRQPWCKLCPIKKAPSNETQRKSLTVILPARGAKWTWGSVLGSSLKFRGGCSGCAFQVA